jgi:hypothetical protein
MSQTSYERCGFLGPMHWHHAGGDPSRPDHGDQGAERPLMRSERPPRRLLRALDRACLQTWRSQSARVASIIDVGASLKSP